MCDPLIYLFFWGVGVKSWYPLMGVGVHKIFDKLPAEVTILLIYFQNSPGVNHWNPFIYTYSDIMLNGVSHASGGVVVLWIVIIYRGGGHGFVLCWNRAEIESCLVLTPVSVLPSFPSIMVALLVQAKSFLWPTIPDLKYCVVLSKTLAVEKEQR